VVAALCLNVCLVRTFFSFFFFHILCEHSFPRVSFVSPLPPPLPCPVPSVVFPALVCMPHVSMGLGPFPMVALRDCCASFFLCRFSLLSCFARKGQLEFPGPAFSFFILFESSSEVGPALLFFFDRPQHYCLII